MKRNRAAALAACVLLCFLVLLLMLVIFGENHNCAGPGCHTCAAAHSAGTWLHGLSLALLLMAQTACAARRAVYRRDIAAPRGFALTPVSLRVRLTN